jgi:para-nitrobenzyl esterase
MTRREFVAGSAAALWIQGRGLWAQSAAVVNAGVVRTPLGALRGEVIEDVRVFRGVPFAEPPVGKLRFRPTVNVKAWGMERNATRFAAAAMQAGGAGVAKSEDCLYLNVWTPQDAVALPVFVWIHGGGFTGGNSFAPIFDGTEFARAGVIVVTVAYRLGVMGFLEMEPLLGRMPGARTMRCGT